MRRVRFISIAVSQESRSWPSPTSGKAPVPIARRDRLVFHERRRAGGAGGAGPARAPRGSGERPRSSSRGAAARRPDLPERCLQVDRLGRPDSGRQPREDIWQRFRNPVGDRIGTKPGASVRGSSKLVISSPLYAGAARRRSARRRAFQLSLSPWTKEQDGSPQKHTLTPTRSRITQSLDSPRHARSLRSP